MALQTTSVLKRNALFRAGELIDGTSSYDSKALEYMNQIYRAILSGGNAFNIELGSPWTWARSEAPATLVLKPKLSLTVAVVNGSSTITFSAPVAQSLAGQWFKVDGESEVYRISSHSAASATAVIDAAYTDDTNASVACEVYFLEYDLPGSIERLIAPMLVNKQQPFSAPLDGLIYQVDLSNMNENYPIKYLPEEIPQQFAVLSKDSFGSMRIRMNASAGELTRVSFDYIPTYPDLYESILENIASSVNISTNTLTTNGPHGLTNGTQVVFDVIESGTLPAGLNREQIYYVVGATSTTLQVSTTLGGGAVDITALGSGSFSFSNIPIIPPSFSNVLEYGASTYLMIDKNDDRAESLAGLTKSKMAAMISANDRELAQSSGGRVGQFIPRLDMYSGPRRYWRQSVTP